jgi:hypothetical protein
MPPPKVIDGSSSQEDNRSREYIDPNNTEKWDMNTKVIETQWLQQLQFVLVLLQYLNDNLKEKEATIGWWIILITSFNSFLTLFDLEKLGTTNTFNINYEWTKSVLLSVLSIITTLLASWVKKKGFVKRIKDLDKRIFSIEALYGKVASDLDLPIDDRPQYITFYKKYITEVQDLLCYNQLISPTEMNFVMYHLTKNYPTLIQDTYPWYSKKENGVYHPNYKFGKNIIKSYEKKQLNGLLYKLVTLFYCKSRCCNEIDDGNPFTKRDKKKALFCCGNTPYHGVQSTQDIIDRDLDELLQYRSTTFNGGGAVSKQVNIGSQEGISSILQHKNKLEGNLSNKMQDFFIDATRTIDNTSDQIYGTVENIQNYASGIINDTVNNINDKASNANGVINNLANDMSNNILMAKDTIISIGEVTEDTNYSTNDSLNDSKNNDSTTNNIL